MWLGKDKVQKSLVKALNRYEKQEELKKSCFSFIEWLRKKYSSGLSRQLSENKPNTKLILLCLKFNKSSKMFATFI